jgi:hypothetical protein
MRRSELQSSSQPRARCGLVEGGMLMRGRVNIIVLMLLSATAGGLIVSALPSLWRTAFQQGGLCKYKQIGAALLNYHDTHKSLPAGTVFNAKFPPEQRLSWLVEILPYLEQKELHGRIAQDKAWDAPENEQAVRQVVQTYLCYANPNQPVEGMPPPTHYVGIAGVGLDAADLPLSDRRSGVFGHDRKTRLSDIKDGQSQTMWLVGTASMNGAWAAGGPGTVRSLVPSLRPYIGANRPFGGAHPGLVHVGMADMSMRTYRDTISPQLFEALATIAGGERVWEED